MFILAALVSVYPNPCVYGYYGAFKNVRNVEGVTYLRRAPEESEQHIALLCHPCYDGLDAGLMPHLNGSLGEGLASRGWHILSTP